MLWTKVLSADVCWHIYMLFTRREEHDANCPGHVQLTTSHWVAEQERQGKVVMRKRRRKRMWFQMEIKQQKWEEGQKGRWNQRRETICTLICFGHKCNGPIGRFSMCIYFHGNIHFLCIFTSFFTVIMYYSPRFTIIKLHIEGLVQEHSGFETLDQFKCFFFAFFLCLFLCFYSTWFPQAVKGHIFIDYEHLLVCCYGLWVHFCHVNVIINCYFVWGCTVSWPVSAGILSSTRKKATKNKLD